MFTEQMNSGSVGKGIGMGAVLTLGCIVASLLLLPIFLAGIGIVQCLWVIPAYVTYRNRGETETAKGILIAAGLVLLVNGSCWGLMMSGRVRMGG
jgi:hypothetical protein